jgi:hypothetical protein
MHQFSFLEEGICATAARKEPSPTMVVHAVLVLVRWLVISL